MFDVQVYNKIGINATIEYLLLRGMCLLIALLLAETLLVLTHLGLLEGLSHHHRVAEGVHVRVQGSFRLLNRHYLRHVYFLDHFVWLKGLLFL